MTIGWRPYDLKTAYMPFAHGVGIQVGKSDPVFMARFGKQPVTDEHPEFPYDDEYMNELFASGDPKTIEGVFFGTEWLKEANSGLYRDWEDLRFLRDNWEGPLVLKGIQSVHVRSFYWGYNNLILGTGCGESSRVWRQWRYCL